MLLQTLSLTLYHKQDSTMNTADQLKGSNLNATLEEIGLHGLSKRGDNTRSFRQLLFNESPTNVLTLIDYIGDDVTKVKAIASLYSTVSDFVESDLVRGVVEDLQTYADSGLTNMDSRNALIDKIDEWYEGQEDKQYALDTYLVSSINSYFEDGSSILLTTSLKNLTVLIEAEEDEDIKSLYGKLFLKGIYQSISEDRLAELLIQTAGDVNQVGPSPEFSNS